MMGDEKNITSFYRVIPGGRIYISPMPKTVCRWCPYEMGAGMHGASISEEFYEKCDLCNKYQMVASSDNYKFYLFPKDLE